MKKQDNRALYLLLLFGVTVSILLFQIRQNRCTCGSDCQPDTAPTEATDTSSVGDTSSDSTESDEDFEEKQESLRQIVEHEPQVSTSSTAEDYEQIQAKTKPRVMPDSYYEQKQLADELVEDYWSGYWSGNPSEKNGHTVYLSDQGELFIDEHCTSPSDDYPQTCIDFPKDVYHHDYWNQYVFILGEGTYTIENNQLAKYVRGQKVELSGGPLKWDGMDVENYRPFNVYIYYDEPHDTIFIVASSIPYDLSNEELKYNVGVYLYMVPDRTKSEIKFVDEITKLNIDEYGLFYSDTYNDVYRYIVSNGKLKFVKSLEPTLADKLYSIAEGEVTFSWWCAFADGHICERDEFPEGTFTHPVVTTEPVSLTAITPDCKYLDLY